MGNGNKKQYMAGCTRGVFVCVCWLSPSHAQISTLPVFKSASDDNPPPLICLARIAAFFWFVCVAFSCCYLSAEFWPVMSVPIFPVGGQYKSPSDEPGTPVQSRNKQNKQKTKRQRSAVMISVSAGGDSAELFQMTSPARNEALVKYAVNTISASHTFLIWRFTAFLSYCFFYDTYQL